MSQLSFYLERTESDKKKECLKKQYHSASNEGYITCAQCDQKRALTMAFRCLYCGIWFCMMCAEKHFGMTIPEWTVKKRIEKRKELQKKYDEHRGGNSPHPDHSEHELDDHGTGHLRGLDGNQPFPNSVGCPGNQCDSQLAVEGNDTGHHP